MVLKDGLADNAIIAFGARKGMLGINVSSFMPLALLGWNAQKRLVEWTVSDRIGVLNRLIEQGVFDSICRCYLTLW
jgi:hypothetical protein